MGWHIRKYVKFLVRVRAAKAYKPKSRDHFWASEILRAKFEITHALSRDACAPTSQYYYHNPVNFRDIYLREFSKNATFNETNSRYSNLPDYYNFV